MNFLTAKRALPMALAACLAVSACVPTTTPGDDNPAAVTPSGASVVPGQFPAVDPARLESLVQSAVCSHTTSRGSRSIGQTDGYHGYAIRLCNPDQQPEGAVVAWVAQRGQGEIIVTNAAGQPYPRRPGGNVNHADSNNQLAIFGLRMSSGPAGCVVARSNWLSDPFGIAFCQAIEG